MFFLWQLWFLAWRTHRWLLLAAGPACLSFNCPVEIKLTAITTANSGKKKGRLAIRRKRSRVTKKRPFFFIFFLNKIMHFPLLHKMSLSAHHIHQVWETTLPAEIGSGETVRQLGHGFARLGCFKERIDKCRDKKIERAAAAAAAARPSCLIFWLTAYQQLLLLLLFNLHLCHQFFTS